MKGITIFTISSPSIYSNCLYLSFLLHSFSLFFLIDLYICIPYKDSARERGGGMVFEIIEVS